MINARKLLLKNRALFLAYDQGLEHGPRDFNLQNSDPKYILDIALEGKYTGVILQNGLAEKYYHEHYRDVPLIVKLNGKTEIPKVNPISRQICSVDRAIKLGASAVGYTIYDGSPVETVMFQEFGKIVEEAHNYGLPVIAWMYPRGPTIKNDLDTDLIAYSARIALELGADFVKLKWNGDAEGYKWIVKNAGRARVLVAGGDYEPETDFLKMAEQALSAGVTGFAIGRNIWQHPDPIKLSKALHEVVFHRKSAEEARKLLL
ncbi:MAG: fructose-bisphosphate aldolase [Candidatus Woesearchaeota archaeon]